MIKFGTLIFITILFLPLKSFGTNNKFQTWKIGDRIRTFAYFPKLDLLLSRECFDLNKTDKISFKCKKKLDYIKHNKTKINQGKNGQHPGSIFCTEILNAEVRIASDRLNNEKSFCQIEEDFIINNMWILKNRGTK